MEFASFGAHDIEFSFPVSPLWSRLHTLAVVDRQSLALSEEACDLRVSQLNCHQIASLVFLEPYRPSCWNSSGRVQGSTASARLTPPSSNDPISVNALAGRTEVPSFPGRKSSTSSSPMPSSRNK